MSNNTTLIIATVFLHRCSLWKNNTSHTDTLWFIICLYYKCININMTFETNANCNAASWKCLVSDAQSVWAARSVSFAQEVLFAQAVWAAQAVICPSSLGCLSSLGRLNCIVHHSISISVLCSSSETRTHQTAQQNVYWWSVDKISNSCYH